METGRSASSDSQLRDFLSVMRQRSWMIALVTALLLAGTVYFTRRQVPVYQSQARVLVRPIQPLTYASFFDGPVNLMTERGIGLSVVVAEKAAAHMSTDLTPEQLMGGLAVNVEQTGSEILVFAYSSTDPAFAQKAAQAFAEGYLDFRREQALEQVRSQTADLQAEASQLEKKLADLRRRTIKTTDPGKLSALVGYQTQLSARYGILQQQMQNLTGTNSIQGGGGEIVAPAELPSSPISPNPTRNYFLAIVLGVSLGTGLAFVLERLDDRLRYLRLDLEEQLGVAVLATIPQVKGWKKKAKAEMVTLEAPRSAPAEAYRSLRTNIRFMMRERDVRSITITSAMLGDGKTTTTANLAAALALSGSRVIAVSGDLRKPRLHEFFALQNKVGLANVLRDEATLLEALQRTTIDNLRVLASGPVPPDPAELLSSAAMEDLVGVLSDAADIVVFDSPPVLAVADALVFGPKTDGVVVVADASKATRSELRRVREEIEQIGGVILGGVINSFNPDRVRYYSPEYSHRYGEYYKEHPRGERAGSDVETSEAGGSVDSRVSPAPNPIWD